MTDNQTDNRLIPSRPAAAAGTGNNVSGPRPDQTAGLYPGRYGGYFESLGLPGALGYLTMVAETAGRRTAADRRGNPLGVAGSGAGPAGCGGIRSRWQWLDVQQCRWWLGVSGIPGRGGTGAGLAGERCPGLALEPGRCTPLGQGSRASPGIWMRLVALNCSQPVRRKARRPSGAFCQRGCCSIAALPVCRQPCWLVVRVPAPLAGIVDGSWPGSGKGLCLQRRI